MEYENAGATEPDAGYQMSPSARTVARALKRSNMESGSNIQVQKCRVRRQASPSRPHTARPVLLPSLPFVRLRVGKQRWGCVEEASADWTAGLGTAHRRDGVTRRFVLAGTRQAGEQCLMRDCMVPRDLCFGSAAKGAKLHAIRRNGLQQPSCHHSLPRDEMPFSVGRHHSAYCYSESHPACESTSN